MNDGFSNFTNGMGPFNPGIRFSNIYLDRVSHAR